MLPFLQRHYLFLLVAILFFAAVTRLYRLAEPREYVFDEVYHALTAKLIARNDVRAYEWWNQPVEPKTAVDWLHPPLAKYTQALGILVFGENTFGWRISAAIFGVLVIATTAKLAQQLFQRRKIALLAAAFASLDGLLLVQSRIAMNDIHVTFFILLTLICYLRYHPFSTKKVLPRKWWWLFLTGLSAGLAMASKWSGIYVLLIVVASEIVCGLNALFLTSKKSKYFFSLKESLLYGLCIFIIPAVVYVLSYSQMFLQRKSLICRGEEVLQNECYCRQESSWWVTTLKNYGPKSEWMWQTSASIKNIWQLVPNTQTTPYLELRKLNFWENLEARGGCKRLISHFSELHYQIFWYQTHLTATHPYQSRPIEWFLNLRPVWFYTQNTTEVADNIYAFGNPIIFWIGDAAVIVTALVVLWQIGNFFFQRTKNKKATLNSSLLLLFSSYLIVWLPWQLSPRIMFFYHYSPAVPLLCILLAYWLIKIAEKQPLLKWLPYLILVATLICFGVWFPHWTALPVSMDFANRVYFALPTWR